MSLLQIRSLGSPRAPWVQAAAEMLIGLCVACSVSHPCVALCGTIKVSITAHSWHVGAAELIMMLVFNGKQTEKTQAKEDSEGQRPGKIKVQGKYSGGAYIFLFQNN